MSRLPALDEAQMSDEARRVASAIVAGPRGEVRGPFIPLLHNPAAADAVQRMGAFLRFDGTLPGDLREMVILMVARRWTAQYEWFAHHRIALDEGLSAQICDAIAVGQRPTFDNPQFAATYDFVDALLTTHVVDDALYAPVADFLGPSGTVELIVLCGHYHTISMLLNTFEVEVPGGETPLAPLD